MSFFLLACSNKEKFIKLEIIDESSKVVLSDNKCTVVESSDPDKLILVVSDAESLKEVTKEQLGKSMEVVLDGRRRWTLSVASVIDSGIITLDFSEAPIFDNEEDVIDHLLDVK
jgi:hypothetical protein